MGDPVVELAEGLVDGSEVLGALVGLPVGDVVGSSAGLAVVGVALGWPLATVGANVVGDTVVGLLLGLAVGPTVGEELVGL